MEFTAEWCALTFCQFLAENTSRAAAFNTDCNRLNRMSDMPAIALNYNSRPYWPPVLESRNDVVSNAARYGYVAVPRNLLWRQQRHACSWWPRHPALSQGCVQRIQVSRLCFRYERHDLANMTSSTNRKHITIYCREMRTETWPQLPVACTENFVKFGHERTDM